MTEDGVDYAFEAVGTPETARLALEFSRPGGFTCLVGIPATGATLELDPLELVHREKTLSGSLYGSEDPVRALPDLLEHVACGRIELSSLVGPSFPLDQVNEAIDASLEGAAGRVLVTMGG